MQLCVYRITCVPTGHVYFGVTRDLEARFAEHMARPANRRLRELREEHLPNAFRCELLGIFESQEALVVEAREILAARRVVGKKKGDKVLNGSLGGDYPSKEEQEAVKREIRSMQGARSAYEPLPPLREVELRLELARLRCRGKKRNQKSAKARAWEKREEIRKAKRKKVDEHRAGKREERRKQIEAFDSMPRPLRPPGA